MKKRLNPLGIIVLAAVILITMAACGSENPKALAKQSYDLSKQVLGAVLNPQKTAELEKKTAAIEAKVAKLSEKDKQIYYDELERLSGNGWGDLFNSSGGLFDSDSKMSDDIDLGDVQKALGGAKGAVDSALKMSGGDMQKALGEAKGAVDSALKMSGDDVQKALGDAKGAVDSALKSAENADVQKALDAAKGAADATQKASGALKSLGF